MSSIQCQCYRSILESQLLIVMLQSVNFIWIVVVDRLHLIQSIVELHWQLLPVSLHVRFDVFNRTI